jgi:type I pantothenate kinase
MLAPMSQPADVADLIRARRAGRSPFVVGITGAVAAGKSTLARELAVALTAPDLRVEIVATDGFLMDNAALTALGILNRKGFPESYDVAALRAALAAIRGGPADFPGYSHTLYDIDPALTRRLAPPEVLIVEGLSLHAGARALGLDLLIYLDADEGDLERWYTERFIELWRAAEHDPTSFYARFRQLTEPQTRDLAAQVWRGVNLPNLREHIVAARAVADVVIRKDGDHRVAAVTA